MRACALWAAIVALVLPVVPAALAQPGTGMGGGRSAGDGVHADGPAAPDPEAAELEKERRRVEDLAAKLVASISDDGIVPFDQIAYPFAIVRPGGPTAVAFAEEPADLGGTVGGGLSLARCDVRLCGRIAVAEVVFGPPEQPALRATGYVVMCRQDDWVIRALALAPALPDSVGDAERARIQAEKDAVLRLAGDFGRSITWTGFKEFDGLKAPFVAFDGTTGAMYHYAAPVDFPVPGERYADDVSRLQATVLPGLARATVTLVNAKAAVEFQVFCVRMPERWMVVMAVASPPDQAAPPAPAMTTPPPR
jgi:hypothetical protein